MCAKLLIHAEMGSVVAASDGVKKGGTTARKDGRAGAAALVIRGSDAATYQSGGFPPTAGLATALLDCFDRVHDRVHDFVDREVRGVDHRIRRIVRKR